MYMECTTNIWTIVDLALIFWGYKTPTQANIGALSQQLHLPNYIDMINYSFQWLIIAFNFSQLSPSFWEGSIYWTHQQQQETTLSCVLQNNSICYLVPTLFPKCKKKINFLVIQHFISWQIIHSTMFGLNKLIFFTFFGRDRFDHFFSIKIIETKEYLWQLRLETLSYGGK